MFITSKQIYGLHYDKAKINFFFHFFFSGLGFANFMASCFVGLYYNMIIAWTIYYFFASFTSHLPWDSCNNDFNTECKFQNHFFYLFIYIVVNYFLKKKNYCFAKEPYDFNGKFGNWVFPNSYKNHKKALKSGF